MRGPDEQTKEMFSYLSPEELGASHQTGWTSLVALLLQYGGNLCFERLGQPARAQQEVMS